MRDEDAQPTPAAGGDDRADEPTMWERARARRRRFLDRYEKRRAERHHVLVRPLRITLGVALIVISPIVGAIPGPGGMLVFLPGAFLLASEYRRAALIMDRMEHETIPRLRRLHARLRGGPKPEWIEQDPELWGMWADRRGTELPDTGERRRASDLQRRDLDD